jgi:hypothetical protein
MFNRLGAQNVNYMMYALARDVIEVDAGVWRLRPDKRPRPLVLRMAAGDCLEVVFTNRLADLANPNNAPHPNLLINDQVTGRFVGFHPSGLELVGTIDSDASFVGENPNNSTVPPGGKATYTFHGPNEGAFLVTSHGATFGGEASGGNTGVGLFGAVMVEPPSANMYRSQVTEEELRLSLDVGNLAQDGANPGYLPSGQPIVKYDATYPNVKPWISEGKAGLPILNMLTASNEIVHSDINAIIVGPDTDGSWNSVCPGGGCPYPLEGAGSRNPTVPNRLEPFREFASIWHDEQAVAQAFPGWFEDPVLSHTLHGVRDSFMINYGSGGVGAEIIANRLGVGPMYDCLDCAYEEFFLTAYTVGDPAMVVDIPANVGLEACDPGLNNCEDVGPKATQAFPAISPSSATSMRGRRSSTSSTCTTISGCATRMTTTRTISTPRASARARAIPTRSISAARATATRRRVTPSSTATSTRISRRACGIFSGSTTSWRPAPRSR